MTARHLTGGCLCGALRYRFDPTEAVVDYCHCEMCRRWSGAPVTAWAQVPTAQFQLLQGTARAYRSSPKATRHFCGQCGSPVFMTDPGETGVGIMLGTLDHPAALAPTGHGWESARIPWLHIADEWPRWLADAPHDVAEK